MFCLLSSQMEFQEDVDYLTIGTPPFVNGFQEI